MRYSELLKQNHLLTKNHSSDSQVVKLLSNVSVNLLKEVLEYRVRTLGFAINVEVGSYNTILQDSAQTSNGDLIVVFWETCSIVENFHLRYPIMESAELEEIEKKVKYEIKLFFELIENASLVIFNYFTPLLFDCALKKNESIKALTIRLNEYATKLAPSNVKLVDLDVVIAKTGLTDAFDSRLFHTSKSPYTVRFFQNYAETVESLFRSVSGKGKKVLVFDCDNTLWSGILGEDGLDRIEMGMRDYPGSIFAEVQALALGYKNDGILLAICSKNNLSDVEEVFDKHPDMLIDNGNLAVKKINWKDKVTNIKEIAKDLNVDLDSIVFVDDSKFEVEYVRAQLPQVESYQVPEKLAAYPSLVRSFSRYFPVVSVTEEDKTRTRMYREESDRARFSRKYNNIDEYLASLEISVLAYRDCSDLNTRLAQLSQKTNQFNLTTQRYTEADLTRYCKCQNLFTYAVSVRDKFGESGVVGLCLGVKNSEECSATLETLLLSCRVIGRHIEKAFLDFIVGELHDDAVDTIYASYVATKKNELVRNFYDECSFVVLKQEQKDKQYLLDIKRYKKQSPSFIELIYAN